MIYGTIPGIDKPVSRLVEGTVMLSRDKQDEGIALLNEVYELGCNTFDTGHFYGDGICERILGSWIEERGLREKVVVLDKGAHFNEDRERVTPFDITADLYDSLARLKTDYIDLYLLHRDNIRVHVGPILEVLNEHYEAGRIHAFGCSNWTTARIQTAKDYAAANGLKPFTVSSPNFSLADQVKEPWPAWPGCVSISGPGRQADRDWYATTGMPLFTWSSLAGGFFSGRFRRDNLETFCDELDRACVYAYCYEDNFKRLDRAEKMAHEKTMTIAQIALAYVLNQPLDIYAVVGCRVGAEFRSNVEALDLSLTVSEMAWLDLRNETR
jgi:aryl-alcohol dehydrogenase-like predicted oxidoreductase